MYYAIITDNKLNGKGQCPVSGENTFSVEIAQEVYNDFDRYMWNDTEIVINPNYEQEKINKRRAEFLKEFFLTSLGYIRRSVTMADGGKKDFLSDLLPVISMGVQGGQNVKIIAYNLPDFTSDITDWTQYQHYETVTPQFIQECFLQLSNDFIPISEVAE